MTCKDCEEQTNKIESGEFDIAYYRWGTANIGFIGCEKHLREIFDVLNKIQKEKNNE